LRVKRPDSAWIPAGRAGNTARRAVSQPTVLRALGFDYSVPLSDWKTRPGPDRAGRATEPRLALRSPTGLQWSGTHGSSPCYDIKREWIWRARVETGLLD